MERMELIELDDDLPAHADDIAPRRNPYPRLEAERKARLATVAGQIEAREERAAQGSWIVACGGTETPFTTRTGRRLLYCYQPATGRHAYLDCATDLILSDREAMDALAVY